MAIIYHFSYYYEYCNVRYVKLLIGLTKSESLIKLLFLYEIKSM